MRLSVIILNYNVRHFLQLCLESVFKALEGIDSEVIVVDNDSADDSCQMVRRLFPEVILIGNKANLGFPIGNNIGVAHAKGDYVCILNPDTVVAEDSFSATLDFIRSKPDAGITGVRLIDGTGNFLPESKRGIPRPAVAFYKVTGLYRLSKAFNQYYAAHLPENMSGKADILVGAFMILKRDLYLELGGFDENCFMYSDDIDLSYMTLKKGYSNYYFAGTTVIHYKGESTVKDGQYMRRFRDAMEFFYRKHFRVSAVFSAFMQLGILYFSAVKMLQGRPRSRPIPENFILVSDREALKKAIEAAGSNTLTMVSLNELFGHWSRRDAGQKRTQVIFDSSHLKYSEILDAMNRLKSGQTTFRIIPRTSDFVIGSDSNADRGEVLALAR